MRFRQGAKLDTGQVTDVRGRSFGAPGGMAIGGGGIGLVVLVIYLLLNAFTGGGGGAGGLGGQLASLDGQTVGSGGTTADLSQCKTGADANRRDDCRIVGVVNSVQKFWNGVFDRSNRKYQYVNTYLFTDSDQHRLRYTRPRRSGRSTARPTSTSTSTWASSRTSRINSVFSPRRSWRPTSSRTSTAITSRTSSACSMSIRGDARAPRARACARSSRRTATRACGRRTPSRRG